MGRVKKLFNANYLHSNPKKGAIVSEQNRAYIDRFVSENYTQLSRRFSKIGCHINSLSFDAMDKLNETIISLYTDPDLCFANWEEARDYLNGKFTEKEIRVPIKKPIKQNTHE